MQKKTAGWRVCGSKGEWQLGDSGLSNRVWREGEGDGSFDLKDGSRWRGFGEGLGYKLESESGED